jgi:decaprenylphospho-beta-D-ribofuranose 2-oxidase
MRLDRYCSFDNPRGRLTVEFGVQLGSIIAEFFPRGFFPPVVPGTQFVTVGGRSAYHASNQDGLSRTQLLRLILERRF